VEDPIFYNLVPGGQGFSTREIYQFNKEGVFIKKFQSLELAARELSIKNKGNISLAADRIRNFAGGFRWSYTDTIIITNPNKTGRKKGTKNSYKIKRKHQNTTTIELLCYENGILFKKFDKQEDAALYFNTTIGHINQCVMRSKKGFLYKKKYSFLKGKKNKTTKIIK
jgi:hypothetical protein